MITFASHPRCKISFSEKEKQKRTYLNKMFKSFIARAKKKKKNKKRKNKKVLSLKNFTRQIRL